MKLDTITVAMTGASGAPYALRLLEVLLQAKKHVYLLMSDAAKIVIATETQLRIPNDKPSIVGDYLTQQLKVTTGRLEVLEKDQWFSAVASGSSAPKHMVICPCSMGTLAAVANGNSNHLIERAADVILKEQHKLILVPREAPFSTIHLENMLKLSRMGAVILPANPGFYHKPKAIDDLVNFVVARILDHVDVKHNLIPRWHE